MEVNELKKELERRIAAGYEYVYFADSPGDISKKANCVISPYGHTRARQPNLVNDQEAILDYVSTYPGEYRIGFSRTNRVDNIDVITYNSSTAELSDSAPAEPIKTQPKVEYIRTYEAALADQKEIEKLRYQLKMRDRIIEDLEDEIAALNSQIAEQETTAMADGTVNLINQFAPLLPSLADRFFSLQERKIAAMEGRPAPQPQPTQPQPDMAPDQGEFYDTENY